MYDMDQHPGSMGNTFIVRIWMEWSQAGSCWRGQIVHVQSGQKATFLYLDEMLGFMRGYVTIPQSDGRKYQDDSGT